MQMAQTQAYGGETEEANNNINKVDLLIKDYPNADYDMGLYWYIKSKIFLMEGKYQQALDAVDQNIKAESHMAQDVFTAPTFILKSEILNYQEQYNNSYKIIKKIIEQEKDSGFDDHEVKARMFTQLSRAELGLGQIDSAFAHADDACKILQNNQYGNYANINVEYAAALVAKADVLLYKGVFVDAMQAYSKAEAVYLNRYGIHYYNVDDVAYLLSRGAYAAS
jgi:tetratricopeptide (TPR) repeat protein